MEGPFIFTFHFSPQSGAHGQQVLLSDLAKKKVTVIAWGFLVV
jgi:hypothetical protein